MQAPIDAFAERMRADSQPESAIRAFARLYECYRGGICDWEIHELTPPDPARIIHRASMQRPENAPYDKLAWVVLNGGIGTTMRMDRAKSLVPVREGKSFLEIIAGFAAGFRKRTGVDLPVLFMNSYSTRGDTLAALESHSLGLQGLPLDFLQHRFPRIRAFDGLPFGDPGDPSSWAPPGHGDIYLALAGSGVMENLLERGIRWIFASNADNLGAAPDGAVLSAIASAGLEFALEVTPKTELDVKGGSLVMRDGRLALLELAQVPEDLVDVFMDRARFPYFNTNNVWMDLEAVKKRMDAGALDMPVIVNRKNVGGVDVVQLEQAMGAAIGSFDRTAGIVVDRRRFAPVKSVHDLVLRRSDRYRLGVESPLEPVPSPDRRDHGPLLKLDERYYGSVEDADLRIPHPLRLAGAKILTVTGDVRFGKEVKIVGNVLLENFSAEPLLIPDRSVLEGLP